MSIDETASNLIAASEKERDDLARGLFAQIFPSLAHLPSVATVGGKSAIPSDPERVVELSPDNVVVWAWASGGLDRLGIPITRIEQAEIAESWEAIGRLVQKPERTKRLLEFFKTRGDEITESPHDHTKSVPVAVIWHSGANLWRVAVGTNRRVRYLDQLGAHVATSSLPFLPKANGNVLIGFETLLKINPDVIFLPCCALPDDDPARFYAEAHFRPLAAVQNRRIYIEPAGAARMDGAIEWPLLLRWYEEILFFENRESRLRDEFRDDYSFFYGFRLSDDELDRVLSIKENTASAGYSKFERRDRKAPN